MNPKVIMAVAWYRAEDWQRWQAISVDKMEDTYEEWLKEAQRFVLEFTRQGNEIQRVVIEPDEFLKWAGNSGKQVSGSSRSEYAALQLRTKSEQPRWYRKEQ